MTKSDPTSVTRRAALSGAGGGFVALTGAAIPALPAAAASGSSSTRMSDLESVENTIRALQDRVDQWLGNFVTPEQYGAVGDNSADDTKAINAATADAIRNSKTLWLGPRTYRMTSSWNCTAGAHGTSTHDVGSSNRRLKIIGHSSQISIVHFDFMHGNTGIGWDLLGASGVTCQNFSVIGGTSPANCPQVTCLVGDASVSRSGGFIESVAHSFFDVQMDGHGDYVYYNNGLEEASYYDCRVNSYGATGVAVSYVGGGSSPQVHSPNAIIRDPCPSMSQVFWRGGGIKYLGPRAVNLHINAPGGCAYIFHDGHQTVKTATGPSVFMGDDTGGAVAGSIISHCGARDLTLECGTPNPAIQVAVFGAETKRGLHFEGNVGSWVDLTANQIVILGDILDSTIWWNPQEGPKGFFGNVITVSGDDRACFFRIAAERSKIRLSGRSTSILLGTDGGVYP